MVLMVSCSCDDESVQGKKRAFCVLESEEKSNQPKHLGEYFVLIKYNLYSFLCFHQLLFVYLENFCSTPFLKKS